MPSPDDAPARAKRNAWRKHTFTPKMHANIRYRYEQTAESIDSIARRAAGGAACRASRASSHFQILPNAPSRRPPAPTSPRRSLPCGERGAGERRASPRRASCAPQCDRRGHRRADRPRVLQADAAAVARRGARERPHSASLTCFRTATHETRCATQPAHHPPM
jgi:hypothetical protein